MTTIVGAIGAAAVLAAAIAWPNGEAEAPAQLQAPPLPSVMGTCPEPTESASRGAADLERIALARIARYPFAPSEALLALRALADAESCAHLATDRVAGERIAQRAAAFHGRVERDYRAHLMRYEHARRAGRLRSAAADIEFLLTLLAAQDGELVRALRRDSRELEHVGAREKAS